MTAWKTVQGSQAQQPREIDTTTSAVVVYQRKNIKLITIENDDGTTTEMWQYEEREMTRPEWEALNSPAMQTIMQAISDVELSIAMLALGGGD